MSLDQEPTFRIQIEEGRHMLEPHGRPDRDHRSGHAPAAARRRIRALASADCDGRLDRDRMEPTRHSAGLEFVTLAVESLLVWYLGTRAWNAITDSERQRAEAAAREEVASQSGHCAQQPRLWRRHRNLFGQDPSLIRAAARARACSLQMGCAFIADGVRMVKHVRLRQRCSSRWSSRRRERDGVRPGIFRAQQGPLQEARVSGSQDRALRHLLLSQREGRHRPRRAAERWVCQAERLLDHQLRGRQPLVLYGSHVDFEQTNVIAGELGEGTGGVTESFRRRIVLPLAGLLADTDHVLGHELVHAFQFDMIDTGSAPGQNGADASAGSWRAWPSTPSIGPVDTNTAMWLRDAARTENDKDWLPTIDDLNKPQHFPYAGVTRSGRMSAGSGATTRSARCSESPAPPATSSSRRSGSSASARRNCQRNGRTPFGARSIGRGPHE